MKAIATAASGTRHAIAAVAEALLLAAIVAAILVAFAPVNGGARFLVGDGTAAAARNRPSTGGATITVPDGVFGGTTTATTSAGLWVHVSCIAGGTLAMSSWEKTDAYGRATFALGPTAGWTSGGASCTADAGSYNSRAKFVIAGTTSFSVAP